MGGWKSVSCLPWRCSCPPSFCFLLAAFFRVSFREIPEPGEARGCAGGRQSACQWPTPSPNRCPVRPGSWLGCLEVRVSCFPFRGWWVSEAWISGFLFWGTSMVYAGEDKGGIMSVSEAEIVPTTRGDHALPGIYPIANSSPHGGAIQSISSGLECAVSRGALIAKSSELLRQRLSGGMFQRPRAGDPESRGSPCFWHLPGFDLPPGCGWYCLDAPNFSVGISPSLVSSPISRPIP